MARRGISSWVWMIGMFAATACHQSSGKGSIIAGDRLGPYQFTEHVAAGGSAGETIDIEGQVEVLRDSVLVDARPGPCRLDTPTVSQRPLVYQCGTVTLSFDRRDPIMRSTYSVTLTQNGTQQVCARYTVSSTGRSVCAEYRTETIPTSVRRTGTLHLTRVPGSGDR